MTVQNAYYIVAIVVGLIATTLNVVMFLRSRPDRLKAAVQEAVKPLGDRLGQLEEVVEAQGEQLNGQDINLAKIEAEVRHSPNREDINALHHRITDLLKVTSHVEALQKVHAQQVDRVTQYLMENPRG